MKRSHRCAVRQLTTASLALLVACATSPFGSDQNVPGVQDPPRELVQDPPSSSGQGASTGTGSKQNPSSQRVIVQARKWREDARDVPRSVSAVNSAQIRDAGVMSIKDASRFVPNMLVTEFVSRRLSFPYVRGVGSGQGDPAVATFIDGVPQLTVNSTNLPLLGVERVEFLRGPAGALYGRNTVGGAINVITEPPPEVAEVDADVTIGNFNSQDYRVSLGTPIGDDGFSVSIAGAASSRDGYTTNNFTGNDVDDRESYFGRAELRWQPDDNQDIRLTLHGEGARDGGFVLSDLPTLRLDPRRINQDFEGAIERDVFSASLLWEAGGDDLEFTSITSVQDWSIGETADFDFSFIDGVRRFTDEEQTAIYQEFRLGSAEDANLEISEDVELRWLAGVSGFHADSDRSATNEFRPGGAGILFSPMNIGSDIARGAFDDQALGIFGQATFVIMERLEVTGALRWDYERKEANLDRVFNAGGFVVPTSMSRPRETFDEILPRASISYRWCDNVTSYGLASRGFKAGGFNLTSPSGSETFGTETSWTYELGAKTNWLENKLTANAAVFYIDWDDMQLSQFNATTGGFVSNAGAAESHGVELELSAKPLDEVTLFGSFGYVETEFNRFVDQFGQNVRGRNLPFAPETTWSVGGQYSTPLNDDVNGFVRVDHFRVGEFFYDAGNLASERYSLTNFRIGFSGANWRVDGFWHNALDEEYVPVAFQPNPADPTSFVGESAAPQTYGVTVRVTF